MNVQIDTGKLTRKEITALYNVAFDRDVRRAPGSKEAVIERIETARKNEHLVISTKDVIRELYETDRGASYTFDELSRVCYMVKPGTVRTALADLKNPKWSHGDTVKIERDSEGLYRRVA